MANLAVIQTLCGPNDLIIQDSLNHASLIDAARSSGATVRTLPHNNPQKAERLLSDPRYHQRFIVTDSIFSMDGDSAPLRTLADLAHKHDAMLIVDEAHGTGVFGTNGSGVIDELQLSDHPAIKQGVVISTASKALGSLGGLISASHTIIDYLVHKARPLLYTTAVPPSQAASILEAIAILQDEPWRRENLHALCKQFHTGLRERGWQLPDSELITPIFPLITGDNNSALKLAQYLEDQGILGLAIRPPTVAEGSSRVRLTLRTDFQPSDIDRVLDALPTPN